MSISQKEFDEIIGKFKEAEDMRDELWDKCLNLLNKGFETEAYVLLLATWNFAYFRYTMKKMKLDEFHKILGEIKTTFDKLRGYKFATIDFNDVELQNEIKFIYRKLRDYDAIKQTGAAKIMALKNPDLFVMWDTAIRKKYGIDNKGTPSSYINFLITMREEFKDIKGATPKLIDEYNYVVTQSDAKALKADKKTTKR